MDTKTVYEYGVDGVYVGSVALNASDKSPSGAWNIPASCTEIEPTITTGKVNTWNGTAWVQSDEITDVLCYYNNGLSFKTVKSNYTVATGEVIFTTTPTGDQLKESFADYESCLLSIAKTQKITALKSLLYKTDYIQAKYIDGVITAAAYTPIKTRRQEWRNAINSIQTATTIDAVNTVTYSADIPTYE